MGLMDTLNGGIANAMSSPLFNLGAGLIAGAQPGANPGQQLQAAAAGQQKLAMKNMYLRYLAGQLGSLMGPPQPQGQQGLMGSQQPAQPPAPPQGGLMGPEPPPLIAATPQQLAAQGISPNSSAAAPSPPPAAQGPSPFAIPTPDQIGSLPVGGMPAQALRVMAMMNGQSPLEADQQIRAQQLKIAQQQYGPILGQLDTLTKAQSPTQYVKADPRLMQQWQQMAPALGFDPQKGFTDPNVRTAFSFLRNKLAGALTEPTVAPPVQMSQESGPLNSLYSRNPVTNAVTQVRAEEPLKEVVGPNGNVSYVPASKAVGQQAFNSDTYVNPTTTQGMARMIANYEIPPLSGYALRSSQGQAIMAAVKDMNPGYDATAYTTKNTARMKFAVGKQGDIVRSLSVATNHLDQLSQAAQALSQQQLPVLNKLVNAVGVHVLGKDPVTNFNAMKEIVGDEVVKAVVGSSGAEGDREAIKEAFAAARSPEQIQGVIEKYEGLMGGQLQGLKQQYRRSTGLNDFDSFVSTMAQQRLSQSGAGNKPAGVSDAGLLKKWGGQ
jgi:hypothetical protein